MTAGEVLSRLHRLANPANVRGMARFGIASEHVLGISVTELRKLAREIGKSHSLALALWKTGIFEARALAAMLEEPARVSERQMEKWARAFDNWAICDECCGDLFDKTPFAWQKALEWSGRSGEFEKRAGFSLMAALARHDREAAHAQFKPFLAAIRRESGDPRNFVRKAVNWALREIGKRNLSLNRAAIAEAHAIRALGTTSARWIAADALRELQGAAVQARLRRRAGMLAGNRTNTGLKSGIRRPKLENRSAKIETRTS